MTSPNRSARRFHPRTTAGSVSLKIASGVQLPQSKETGSSARTHIPVEAELPTSFIAPLKGIAEFRLPTDAEWSLAVGLPNENGRTPKEKDFGIKDTYPWGKQWPPPEGTGNYYDAAAKKTHSERTGERDRLLSSRRLDGPPEARGTYVGFRVVLAQPAR